jgi:hypothetical protein
LHSSAELRTLINSCDPTTKTTYAKDNAVDPVPDGAGLFLSMKKNLAKKYVNVKNPNMPMDKPAEYIVYNYYVLYFRFFAFIKYIGCFQ